jgi:hypothetical protein
MRPTARGVGVLLVALAAALVGARFGQRGLAAIAAPLFVAFLGAVGQVALTGTPTVERGAVRRGFVGDRREVTLSVGGSGIARITDQRPAGVGGPATATRSLPATVSLYLAYERRGDHRLGPGARWVGCPVGGAVRLCREEGLYAVDDADAGAWRARHLHLRHGRVARGQRVQNGAGPFRVALHDLVYAFGDNQVGDGVGRVVQAPELIQDRLSTRVAQQGQLRCQRREAGL